MRKCFIYDFGRILNSPAFLLPIFLKLGQGKGNRAGLGRSSILINFLIINKHFFVQWFVSLNSILKEIYCLQNSTTKSYMAKTSKILAIQRNLLQFLMTLIYCEICNKYQINMHNVYQKGQYCSKFKRMINQ